MQKIWVVWGDFLAFKHDFLKHLKSNLMIICILYQNLENMLLKPVF